VEGFPTSFFVRKENAHIVQEDGIFGTPDLVVEIWSPGDRLSGHAVEGGGLQKHRRFGDFGLLTSKGGRFGF
jgi:hypothetical protein